METKEFAKSESYEPSSGSYGKFKASFCDPLQKEVIQLGEVNGDQVASLFRNTPWMEHLRKMHGQPEDKIYYSPSLCIETLDDVYGIEVSVVGDDRGGMEFYTFYCRPKVVRKWAFFRSKEVLEPNFCTNVLGHTSQDVVACLTALVNGDLEYLEKTVK